MIDPLADIETDLHEVRLLLHAVELMVGDEADASLDPQDCESVMFVLLKATKSVERVQGHWQRAFHAAKTAA